MLPLPVALDYCCWSCFEMPTYTGHDLTHNVLSLGRMGHLQTIDAFPVVAGDRYAIDIQAFFRLSPLRRSLEYPCKVSFYAFYSPWRHFVQNWLEVFEDGADIADVNINVDAPALSNMWCLGGPPPKEKRIVQMYANIWNHYFRDPINQSEFDLSDLSAMFGSDSVSGRFRRYGYPCNHIQTMHTTPITQMVTAEDYQVDVSNDAIDLRDIEQQTGDLEIALDDIFKMQRYRDVMSQVYGGSTTIDADKRPEFVGEANHWMGSYDVDGTASENIGQTAGKSTGNFSFTIPRKYFGEHGMLFVMVLLRWPPFFENQTHYLREKTLADDQDDFIADPRKLKVTPPQAYTLDELFHGAPSQSAGQYPAGQHLRDHPDLVHTDYFTMDSGYPLVSRPVQRSSMWQVETQPTIGWDRAFQSQRLAHWQMQALVHVDKISTIPAAGASVYAGTL